MEWTYTVYTSCNFGISCLLVVIVFIAVFVCFYGSEKGNQFISGRLIGLDSTEVKKKGANTNPVINNQCICTKDPVKTISFLFCLLAAMVLSITAVLIFNSCFLSITRVLPKDNCPEYPMDCFIFNDSTANPITEKMNFHCDPLNKTQFPLNMTNGIAWCYGWIFRFQTIEDVLDQLGVCTGLIGFFTTLLAVIFYLGRSIKTLILSGIFIITCVIWFVSLPILKWSFAPLTYAVLGLGISLGIFGVILYCLSPREDSKTHPSQEERPPITALVP